MSYGEGSSRPASGFELWSWFFMRISGLLLIFLVLGHLYIMHILNSVEIIDYNFVARRWANIGWRTYDWVMLALALFHGANGIRVIIDDYAHRPGWRTFWMVLLYVVTFILLVLGTVVLVTFPFPA
ncbi:succinate dehydrogenase hydrophobic membrane anchor subunit [Thermaerobacter sp. PB12/4term]|uniref:succinate dehydrogenase hydrophobic membrane anchor subunit n=1 Tax=Thermaerobacter sp. PB12/4term TaxID=2293838 RepID=UPI000E32971E|nr:succinate dehydrogenase hydrophobic membrane anchor subunit [Thermaerobacter sp. PB12/4term]QIA26191.1 succinate dehydrogenase hydrophobic membrane anchor subunit [Thermaerobacter sp. PB12/4term]